MEIKCIAPDAIEDADLLAYLEDAATPTTVVHISACQFCQQKIKAFAQVDLLLDQAAYRESCPDYDVLWQYANVELAQAQMKFLSPHVKSCAYCQQNLRQLAAAAYDPTSPMPQMKSAAAVFLARIQEAGKQILQAIVQPPLQPVPALRGNTEGQTVYQIGTYQIILSQEAATPTAGIWQIEGQIINEGELHAPFIGTTILLRDDEIISRTEVDEVGYFQFVNIAPGQYNLYIDLANVLLSLSDLTIL